MKVIERENIMTLTRKWEQKSFPIHRYAPKVTTLAAKFFFDLLAAGVGILLSAPLWILIALLIWLDDGFPVFYSQERVGKDGKSFYALKFRTMKKDAEEALGPVQALKNDPRVTRIGRVLRKTALDELPQLWNILRGEMSFVGPRPLRPGEMLANERGEAVRLEEIPGFEERVLATPGLTGLAQVYAPRNIHHRHKFRYDLIYVRKQRFWLDMKLIFLSFFRTLTARWEA